MENTEWALACAARGWLVFPSYKKKPLVRWSVSSTTDPVVIRGWFDNEFPMADVCIKTGQESGIVVVDWDAYKQEDPEYFPLWRDVTGTPTYSVRTPKGGHHFYYLHPGYPVANSAGNLAPFVDVRGDGGMVVAYNLDILAAPLQPLPEGWARQRTHTVDMHISLEPTFPYKPGARWCESLLLNGLAEVRAAPEGKRNAVLYAVASDMYRAVWYGNLDKEATTQSLGDAGVDAGLEAFEIGRTLASAMRNAASQVAKEESK